MPKNLLINGGFETGDLTGWTTTDPGPFEDIGVDSNPDDVNSGNFGLFAGNAVTTTLSQSVATIPGHTYTVSFYLDVYQADATTGFFTATFGGKTVTSLTDPPETDNNANPFTLYTAKVTATAASSLLHFTFNDAPGFFGLDDVSVTDDAPCYVRGTRIATPAGERAVECLRVGDLVCTASGMPRPVRWLGRRAIDCTRYGEPEAVWPICIRSGAIARDLPARDLWVSPGHALFLDGVLIQAQSLVNGATVLQMPRDRVEYWHVELDSHDILLAEGVAAESYLDTGNRTGFANGGRFQELYPDFKAKYWSDTCVPLMLEGPAVRAVKARVLARAHELGYALSRDAGVHVIADGQRIEPTWLTDSRIEFLLPGAAVAVLRCHAWAPAHARADSGDTRALGLCVQRWQLDGRDLAMDEEGNFTDGWHALECEAGRQWRWTRASVPLPARTLLLVIDLRQHGEYWSSAGALNERIAAVA